MILPVVLSLSLAACAGDTNPASDTPAAVPTPAQEESNISEKPIGDETSIDNSSPGDDPAVPAALFTEEDLTIVIGGTAFSLNADVSGLLAVLGEDYDFFEAPSCVYEGTDKSYDYAGISIYTYPVDNLDLIDEIVLLDAGYETPKGIKVGSSLEDIIAAYGNGYQDDGDIITYSLDPDPANLKSPRLYFILDEGQITSISYYSASNIHE